MARPLVLLFFKLTICQPFAPLVKYVDDGHKMCEVYTKDSRRRLRTSVKMASSWSEEKDVRINLDKTKEIVICFCEDQGHMASRPNPEMNGNIMDRKSAMSQDCRVSRVQRPIIE